MKINEIQDLIKLVSRSSVNSVTIEKPEFKITIKSEGKKRGKNQESQGIIQQVPLAMPGMQQPIAATQVPVQAPAPAPAPAADNSSDKKDDSASGNYIEVKSPMIGTFYRSSSPDKDAFVQVGDSIKEGQVVCIIEAMKLFNEIESEVSGKIVKILVDDSTPVEYDQPLFLVDPS